jgi:uncharacterized protein YjdB
VMTNTNGDGGANGCNTAGGNPVTFNVSSSQPTKVSLDSSTITFPGCEEANAQTVGYTAVAEGSSVISVSYASGGKTGTETSSAYGTSDTMTVTVNSPNAAPNVPGAPALDSLSSTPTRASSASRGPRRRILMRTPLPISSSTRTPTISLTRMSAVQPH